MAAEKLENNGNQTTQKQETTKNATKTATQNKEEKQTSALSVKEKSIETNQGIQLITEPGHLPGNRPIEASHLKVISTYGAVGTARPVVSSGMEVSSTLAISGQRPIMVSHLQVSETYTVMGNRPVASNEIDDPAMLMGYLD